MHIPRNLRLGALKCLILSARKSHSKRKPYEREARAIRTQLLIAELSRRVPEQPTLPGVM